MPAIQPINFSNCRNGFQSNSFGVAHCFKFDCFKKPPNPVLSSRDANACRGARAWYWFPDSVANDYRGGMLTGRAWSKLILGNPNRAPWGFSFSRPGRVPPQSPQLPLHVVCSGHCGGRLQLRRRRSTICGELRRPIKIGVSSCGKLQRTAARNKVRPLYGQNVRRIRRSCIIQAAAVLSTMRAFYLYK